MTFKDIAAVVATNDFALGRAWYTRVLGREPDLEPIEKVAEWQITATAWLQLIEDAGRAGRSAVRIGVDDLDAQLEDLAEAGIAGGEPVVIADLVTVVDVADPDGNEVSFVAEIGTE